jgi:hypothetical protein
VIEARITAAVFGVLALPLLAVYAVLCGAGAF